MTVKSAQLCKLFCNIGGTNATMRRLPTTNQPMPTQTGEQVMSTEQAQLDALKTLHEAIQALKDLGFITEGNEDE